MPYIPNADCLHCHLFGQARDPFGNAVYAYRNANGGDIAWPALYSLDSDADGYTNGEELGDPCGVWTVGATPAFATATDPGDADETPAAHTIGTCGSGGVSSSLAVGSTSLPGSSGGVVASGSTGGPGSSGGLVGESSSSSSDPRYKARRFVPQEDNNGCSSTAVKAAAPWAAAPLALLLPLALRRRR